MNKYQYYGLLAGPLMFFILLLVPEPEAIPPHAMSVAAVASLMAIYWIFEVIPLAATALFPIVLFPLLGVLPATKVTQAYAHHLIYLFMGGFLIAVTIEKWNLHKRIALRTILIVGVTPQRILLGFMLATALLSAWISNTATAMLMLTIGLAVIQQIKRESICDKTGSIDLSDFSTSLMLGIAYAASIGGVATLIGTPPNAILAGVVESTYGISISFVDWMLFATPLSIFMLAICWLYLTRLAFPPGFSRLPGGRDVIYEELKSLGAMSVQEKRVLAVFVLVIAGWLGRGLLNIDIFKQINDSTIAMAGALLLFIIPADIKKAEFLLDWKTAVTIPWDIIILFGGGFALASGFASSGLTEWMASQLLILKNVDLVIMVAMVVVLVIFLTEITSNTATASLVLPVMGAFALAVDLHPLYLMVAVAVAASYAFMLPVATPPNAIVFSSRQISMRQMARAGLWLNLVGVLLITLFVLFLLPQIFDLNLEHIDVSKIISKASQK